MGARRVSVAVFLAAACAACSASRPALQQRPVRGLAPAGAPVAAAAAGESEGERRYVDEELGFELVRPARDWQLDESDERTPEGLAVPVILRHRSAGAQVVLQVAPAVASPAQFALRLTEGLRAQPGFTTSDPEPLPLSEHAVGFSFSLNDTVHGRVAVRDGSPGRVFMMMATWPVGAPRAVRDAVDEVFASVRPLGESAPAPNVPMARGATHAP